MNQTDLQGETERALRAITCEGCKAGETLIDGKFVESEWHYGTGKTIHKHSSFPCTSKHAELLPLFNAGMEQARIEQDEHWIDAMGWTDLVHNGPYTQSDRENYVKLLVDSVTYNMHEEAPPEQIATAVAGAYAAAAKVVDDYELLDGKDFHAKYYGEVDLAPAIRALTPADARQSSQQKPVYCLGWATIEKVAVEGALQTETVDFVAADDFYHSSPIALAMKAIRDIRAERNQAIASAEARARLEEAELAHDNEMGHVAHSAICKSCDDSYYCHRIKELEAAARTPDSTPKKKKPIISPSCEDCDTEAKCHGLGSGCAPDSTKEPE